ncbi:MAG: AcrB/AcrD/AcrF family protein, partial [Thermodesulfatator sp.]
MRAIITWFIKNPVAANLLLLLVFAGGLLSLLTMKVEVIPEVSPDQIEISVEYRGASPQEIEESVIRPIEERIASLSGIDRIISTAREGQGTILVEVLTGWDVHELFNDIKTEVDGLTTLPREAERPIVRRVVLRREVLNLALYGEADRETLKYWAERVKDRLLELSGITEVEYHGLLPREIHIEIPEKSLRKYGLSLDQVAEMVARESLDLAGGRLKNPREEYLVRVRGRRYFADEYRFLRLFG